MKDPPPNPPREDASGAAPGEVRGFLVVLAIAGGMVVAIGAAVLVVSQPHPAGAPPARASVTRAAPASSASAVSPRPSSSVPAP